MIQVTTVVSKQHGPERSGDTTGSWRVQSCRVDFGAEREPLNVSSHFVYISPEYAHEDMKEQALEKLRSEGYAVSEADIVWRLHMIG
jgi:hypothetical protein